MSNNKASHAEIEAAMINAVETMRNDCTDRIAHLSADAKNEKKALSAERGMYTFCLNAGCLSYPLNNRTSIINSKCTRMPRFLGKFPKLQKAFDEADPDEKLRLAAAFYGIVWMEDQVLPKYRAEYEQARSSGDIRREFEMNIQLRTVESVLRRWRDLAADFGYAGLCEVSHGE